MSEWSKEAQQGYREPLMRWYQNMIVGLCEIVDGVLSIVTFGQYRINLAFKATSHFSISNLRNK